ncbi:hypothetical protein FGB62_240g02 [Gracilaria domingensis]|nr:hypothetical protein FGB62_240g02 [Gracilaria domingensis]
MWAGKHRYDTEIIVDIVPNSIHTRVPVLLGGEDDVNFATGFHKDAPRGTYDQNPKLMLRLLFTREKKIKRCRVRSPLMRLALSTTASYHVFIYKATVTKCMVANHLRNVVQDTITAKKIKDYQCTCGIQR